MYKLCDNYVITSILLHQHSLELDPEDHCHCIKATTSSSASHRHIHTHACALSNKKCRNNWFPMSHEMTSTPGAQQRSFSLRSKSLRHNPRTRTLWHLRKTHHSHLRRPRRGIRARKLMLRKREKRGCVIRREEGNFFGEKIGHWGWGLDRVRSSRGVWVCGDAR